MHRALSCLGEVLYCFSKVTRLKISPILTQFGRFRTATPVWIHQWLQNYVQSLQQHRIGAYCFSRPSVKFQGHTGQKTSILTQIGRYRTVTLVWIHWWLRNDAQSLKQHTRGALLFFKIIRQISRSHRTTKLPIKTRIERFRTVTPVWSHPCLWNDTQSLM